MPYSSYCLNPSCQQPENALLAKTCQNCHTSLLLNQRFRAFKPLGAGGMGRTFLAIDESLAAKPRCVIKQFFPQNLSPSHTPKAAELFRQEAQRLSELGDHPQIPKLLDSFEQDGEYYLVQEYISGRNLAAELQEEGPFSEAKIRHLLENLLPVLQFIHDHNVIHRDIKPENIIRRSQDQTLVLVDFGAAKFTTETQLGATGTVIGSAAYTAPEQVRGKAVFASDLYSLAVTCLHLLTMLPPFDLFDSSEDAWVWRDYLKNPVSKPLGIILDKMLENATKLRYHYALSVLLDLKNPKLPIANAESTPRKTHWLAKGMLLLLIGTPVGWALLSSQPRPSTVQTYTQTPVAITPTNPAPPPVVVPNYGGLYAKLDNQQIQTLPLKHTEVTAKIDGNVSRVEVVQSFENPFETPLEAIYKFPLPDEAAVDDMEIRIGERTIRGVIKKREEAKIIYEQAKQAGQTTGLLEQERDNIFTQSLANIKPGETIEVIIRYSDSLKFEGGDYEFVFPMVVGPRYQASGNPESATAVNPPITPSTSRSRHDINVTVEIDAGVAVSNVVSPSHKIQTQTLTLADRSVTQVQLSPDDTIPNKDLILRYQVAGKTTQATVLTQDDHRGGHFAAYLIPAVEYQKNEIVPKDVVFLMDTSGSQEGEPLKQSKALMRRFIQGLNPQDTFTIIDFADSTQALSTQPLANTPNNQQKALNYINQLNANGGTELLNGIKTVLNFPAQSPGRLRSIVLITDGYIDNETQIIAQVQQQLKPGNRLYSFGVGSSVNRFLLDRLAETGRGISYVVRYDEPLDQVTETFFSQINNPVLTNIEVTWQGLGKAPEIYPLQAPDLFAEQPLVLLGRKQDRLSGQLQITGTATGGKPYRQTFDLQFDQDQGNLAIAQLWGRAKIKELTMAMVMGETTDGIAAVTDIALAYGLMSKYTAFVAVSDEVRVDGADGAGQTAEITVETPDGMSSSNTVDVPEPATWPMFTFVLYLGWKRWRRQKRTKTEAQGS